MNTEETFWAGLDAKLDAAEERDVTDVDAISAWIGESDEPIDPADAVLAESSRWLAEEEAERSEEKERALAIRKARYQDPSIPLRGVTGANRTQAQSDAWRKNLMAKRLRTEMAAYDQEHGPGAFERTVSHGR